MPAFLADPTVLTAAAIGAALVVFGLFVYGLRDVRRFSLRRAWAVGGVAFREGVRRKVLWVTPLAMLAVLLLVQLAEPANEPDAIRQAVQSALFASGLIAILVPLILSCTSLPREIESKVIFTIVTKPLTRLELLVGKLLGFARLSALVLAIMGVFAYGLLVFLDLRLTSQIENRLDEALANESRRPYLRHLANDGLLRAQELDQGEDLQVYAELPAEASDDYTGLRWMLPTEYYAAVPFEIDPADAAEIFELASDPETTVLLQARVRAGWRLMPGQLTPPGALPVGVVNLDNLPEIRPPFMRVQFLDGLLFNVIAPTLITDNPLRLPASPEVDWSQAPDATLSRDQTRRVVEEIVVNANVFPNGRLYVSLWGLSPRYIYGVGPDSALLELVDASGNVLRTWEPAIDTEEGPRGSILFRTHLGNRGIGLSGPDEEVPAPIGVLAYRDTPPAEIRGNGMVGFELFANVDRTGGILDEGDVTRLEVQVINIDTGYASEPQVVEPETNQGVWLTVPAEAVEGGNFNLRLQTLSRGHIVSIRSAGIRFAVDSEAYWVNLLKALMGQWLLSVLVAACGLTFSTFVSWPIALVLTVSVLSGRWVADQLGSAFEGQLGRGVVQQIFSDTTDVAAQQVVERSFDALGAAFETITRFLPDLGIYDAAPLVEEGIVVPWAQLGSAAGVTLIFTLPLLALAYVVLRNKEVAP